MSDNTEFCRANTLLAVSYFIFARRRYLKLAVRHAMAINLEAPDLLQCYKDGKYPQAGWEERALENASNGAKQVQAGLSSSFFWVLTFALLALFVGFVIGSLDIGLPLNTASTLVFIGTFLSSWATLMELGGGFRTWSGEALQRIDSPYTV
jgi:hypothetical protein